MRTHDRDADLPRAFKRKRDGRWVARLPYSGKTYYGKTKREAVAKRGGKLFWTLCADYCGTRRTSGEPLQPDR